MEAGRRRTGWDCHWPWCPKPICEGLGLHTATAKNSQKKLPTIWNRCGREKSVRASIRFSLIDLAFVTGNPKKLEEVKYILKQGGLSIPLKSCALDCNHDPQSNLMHSGRSAGNDSECCNT
jgi:hypothetical protein